MIIDGKGISQKIKNNLKEEVLTLNKEGIYPSLSVIMVGNDPSSKIYVTNKSEAAKEVGIISNTYLFPENVCDDDVISLIEALNNDKKTNGILVQLPLPPHLDEKRILSKISENKDVDGFHYINSGKVYLGEWDGLLPCTANGIITLIKSTGESIEGKNAVVIGRSKIVGRPVSMLLLKENATVTICHSYTNNLKELTKQADILVVAVGKKHFVTKDMVKKGAIVIDVGINRENGKLYGDVDFDNVEKVAKYITPVPKGVGPMTIAMLLYNTVLSAKKK